MGRVVETMDLKRFSVNRDYVSGKRRNVDNNVNLKGRGSPHPEHLLTRHRYDKICGETVMLSTICQARKAFVYIVSLEFALGNMDQLRQR